MIPPATIRFTPSGAVDGSIADWLKQKPDRRLVGACSHVEISRGSSAWTSSRVARYRPIHEIRRWSWARSLIWAVYQSGSADSGTTRRTFQTGSVEITA